MNTIRSRVLLAMTVLLGIGLLLRFVYLDRIPAGPEWDEASVGYNAFSIAQTGKDEWGNRMPLMFPAFGDYKNPLYIYLTAIPVKILGLNLFTTRFFNALSSFLLIIVYFAIAEKLFKNTSISLLTALFVTFSPFGIFFGRIAGDGIMLSVLLISLGVLSELQYLDSKKSGWFILALCFLFCSVFSYNLARIVAPILILVFFGINIKCANTEKRTYVIPILISVFLLFALLQQAHISITSRLQEVGIFGKEQGVVLEINNLRHDDRNTLLSKILHNKPILFGITLIQNYLTHFGTDFLGTLKDHGFVSESHYPPLHLIMIPFYYFGLILLVYKNIKKPDAKQLILIILLLIAPFPSMITEAASGKRDLAQLGVMELITAYGIYHALRKKNIFIKLTVTVCFVTGIGFYLYMFFIRYPVIYGYIYSQKEHKICSVLQKHYGSYDRIVYSQKLSGEPYIFPLFCLQFSPKDYRVSRKSVTYNGWFTVEGFGKFRFVPEITPAVIRALPKKKHIALFVTEEEEKTISPLLRTILSPEQFNKQSQSLLSNTHNQLFLFTFTL